VSTAYGLAVALIVSGCSRPGTEPTITLAEANRIVDDYIERAVAALPDEAELEELTRHEGFSCEKVSDGGPKERKSAARSYQVVGLENDLEGIMEHFDALRAWWQANNFEVERDNTIGRHKTLHTVNRDDRFTMTFTSNKNRALFLEASSPCVRSGETPDPQ
jgi:hypothetical protein